MNKTKTYSLIIADDHPLFRAGVRQILEKESSFKILAEAGDGETAIRYIRELKPDIAVLDIQMPKLSGLKIAQQLKSGTSTKLIFLTVYNDQAIFLQAIENDVMGYVLKDAAETDIVDAVNAVAEEKYYLSPNLGGLLLARKKTSSKKTNTFLTGLTQAEIKILALIAELKSNKEIADTLFISKRTVENHKVNIAHKLNISGTNSLLKFAIQNKDLLGEI